MSQPNDAFDALFARRAPYFKTTPTSFLLEFLQDHRGMRSLALDIGCGNGRNAIAIARHDYKVVAIDVSAHALALARAFSQQESVDIAIVAATASQLPIHNTVASCVFAGTALSCLSPSQQANAFQEISRVIRTGGFFLFTDFSVDDPGAHLPSESELASPCASLVKTYFAEEMLANLLSDFHILSQWRTNKFDDSHDRPHYHSLIRIIAQKV